MTATDVNTAKTVDGTNVETSTDGSDVTTGLAGGLSDDNTTTEIIKVGKSPEDILRLDYAIDPTGLAVGDTITAHTIGFHNITDLALYAYDTANGVASGSKIVIVGATASGANVFTFTQAFIDDLLDQGGGSFSVRIHEDAWDISTNAGDYKLAEVDADGNAHRLA